MAKEIPLRQLERQSHRISTIIEQRRSTFDQIGTGQVRLDTATDPQTYLDTAHKIGGVKKRVAESIDRLSAKQTELSTRIRERKLDELRSYVEQGLLPPSVLEPLQKTVFPEAPIEQPVVFPKPTFEAQTKAEKPKKPGAIYVRPYRKDAVLDIYGKEDEASRIELASGQIIELKGGLGPTLLEAIDSGVNAVGELAMRIYGEDNSVTRNRINAGIVYLNKRLLDHDLIIRNSTSRHDRNLGVLARYELEITRPKGVIHPEPLTETEIERIPHQPSPDEVRSPEESRVLGNVVSLFKKGTIDFAFLQRALVSEERITNRGGKRLYRPYNSRELKDLFESAIKKLREEAASKRLRDQWTEDDQKMWQEIEVAVKIRTNGDFDEFIFGVKRALDLTQRLFYRNHPPRSGANEVEYIELGDN